MKSYINVFVACFLLCESSSGVQMGTVVDRMKTRSIDETILDKIKCGHPSANRNLLYCKNNGRYYWNNIYPAGPRSNYLGNIKLRDVSDILESALGYNYRDTGLSDALQSIQARLRIISKSEYRDILECAILEKDLSNKGENISKPPEGIVQAINEVLNAANLIARIIRKPLIESLGDFTTLDDVIRVANEVSQQIMFAILTYVRQVDVFNEVNLNDEQIKEIVSFVGVHNLFITICRYFDFAHTEREVWYDIVKLPCDVDTVTLASHYDMCDKCEAFLARQSNMNKKINMISCVDYKGSRTRNREVRTNNLKIHYYHPYCPSIQKRSTTVGGK